MRKPCSGSVVTRSPARATAPTGSARSAESIAEPYTCGNVDRTICSNLSGRRVRENMRSKLTRTVSPARSATIVSRRAVRPGGTTGATATPDTDALDAGARAADDACGVRAGVPFAVATADRITESLDGFTAGLVESVWVDGVTGVSPAAAGCVPCVPIRARIAVAPAMPTAAITASRSVAAAPRAIICRWRARLAARSACWHRRQTVIPGRSSWSQGGVERDAIGEPSASLLEAVHP